MRLTISSGSARNNSATTNAGAFWFDDYSELLIDNVIFQYNHAGFHFVIFYLILQIEEVPSDLKT